MITESPPLMGINADAESQQKKNKTAVLYLSSIPPGMSVTRLREQFNLYSGDRVGRISLTEKKSSRKRKKPKPNAPRFYSEGWVEILSKRLAKMIAAEFNNQPMAGSKKNKWYDFIWNIKYLSGFKWSHLTEQLRHERAVRQDRLRTEIALAKKEAHFYVDNVQSSERMSARAASASNPDKRPDKSASVARVFRQQRSSDEILRAKGLTLGREDRLGVMRSVGLFGIRRVPDPSCPAPDNASSGHA